MSSRKVCAFALALASVLVLASSPSAAQSTTSALLVRVDCAKDTLQSALERRADQLTIEFAGTCAENVTMTRDRVLLRGLPNAQIAGTVVVYGGSAITFETFRVAPKATPPNTPCGGIRVRNGGAAILNSIAVESCPGIGLRVEGGSSVEVSNSSFNLNGFAGISISEGATARFTGNNVANDNSGLGLFVSTSGSVVSFNSLETNGNGAYGVGLQVGGSGQFGVLTANGNAIVGLSLLDGASAAVTTLVADDNDIGVSVSANSTLEVANLSVDGSSSYGILVDTDSTATFAKFGGSAAVTGATPQGVTIEGSRADFSNLTTTLPVSLEFGSRVRFAGTNTVPNLTCDGTVLTAGPVSCPP